MSITAAAQRGDLVDKGTGMTVPYELREQPLKRGTKTLKAFQ